MPVFDDELKGIFYAANGAYSDVTDREATGDKSVTLDGEEKRILYESYGEGVFSRGGDSSPDTKPRKRKFHIYDVKTGKTRIIDLTIIHPKSDGNELRLYFSVELGFSPPKVSTWFIFTRKLESIPFIGFVEGKKNLTAEHIRALQYDKNHTLDEGDDEYQESVFAPEAQREARTTRTTAWPRDPSRAAEVIKSHHFLCQYNKNHKSFTSAATGQQYIEAHHLIPLAKSQNFSNSLDVPANIIPLCPNCHRAIHFATSQEKRPMLTTLFEHRKNALQASNLELDLAELLAFYGADD